MMTFKEFIAEAKTKGTYAALRFDDHSKDLIAKYIADNNIPNPVPVDKLHCTLLYSRNYCDGYTGDPDACYRASVGDVECWPTQSGKTALVANLVCPELCDRHKHLMNKYQATYDYPEYKPHFTLSYDAGDFDTLADLKPFVGVLTLVGEYNEDLDLDWKP